MDLQMQHEDKSISLRYNYQIKASLTNLDLQVDKEVSLDHSKLQPLNHLENQESVFSADYSKTETKKKRNLKAFSD